MFWDVPRDLRRAVADLLVLLNHLGQEYYFGEEATAQLLVLCNRNAVHDLLQHGFISEWQGGIRISTASSAAGATAKVAVVVQTGTGFLSGSRYDATTEDRGDCFGRATVACSRAILCVCGVTDRYGWPPWHASF